MNPTVEELGYSAQKLGQTMQKVREHWGWTQEQLAGSAGTSREVIAHLEQGKRRVYLDLVVRCAKAMQYPLTLFLAAAQESDEMPKAGESCLLLMLPGQQPLLVARFVRQRDGFCHVRIGDNKGTPIAVLPEQVRRIP